MYSDSQALANNLSNVGIPTVKKITDLYAIKASGFYYYDAGTTNAPMSSRGGMIVANYLSDSWISLTVVPYASSKIYTNTKYNNTWVGWAESATKDDVFNINKSTYSILYDKNYAVTLSGPLATDKEKVLNWFKTLPDVSLTFHIISGDAGATWINSGGRRFVIVFKYEKNYGAMLIMDYFAKQNLGYAVVENGVLSDIMHFQQTQ